MNKTSNSYNLERYQYARGYNVIASEHYDVIGEVNTWFHIDLNWKIANWLL